MKAYVASHLKEMNRHEVYQLIRSKEKTSKAEITKITGISSPTVIKIVNFLESQGLIVEIGEAETAIGRRPHMLKLNTDWMYAASFVLEGDYLTMGIVDIAGEVRYRKGIPVSGSYQSLMEKLREEYIDQLLEEVGISEEKLFGIGIALPVIYDKEAQMISGAPLIQETESISILEDIQRLEEKYHVLVMVENDTNAQTIGEFQKRGYGSEDDLVFISSGTGLGAGLILRGRLRRGSNFMCGEIGYMALEESYHSDKKKLGWMEEKISHRRIIEKFGVDITKNDQALPAKQKQEIISFLAKPLALAVHNINACLDCQNVVLGGQTAEYLGQELIDAINSHLAQLSINHAVIRMESTENVGLIGMAWLLTNRKIKDILKSDITD